MKPTLKLLYWYVAVDCQTNETAGIRAAGGTAINNVFNKEQCLFACIKDVSIVKKTVLSSNCRVLL